jgi:hypothetical protein
MTYVYKNKTLIRLKKKLAPSCEQMNREEFEDWMVEEVVRYCRTKEITSGLVSGIARGVRSAVLFSCKRFNRLEWFDDLLNDTILQVVEKDLSRYDPVRGGIIYYLSLAGFRYAWKRVQWYHLGEPLDNYSDTLIAPAPSELFFIEDFADEIMTKKDWRMHPALCSWAVHFVLIAARPSDVLMALTTFIKSRSDARLLYFYVLVTMRIELAQRLERHSEYRLSKEPDNGIPSSFWNTNND